jgi:hypothetical protein
MIANRRNLTLKCSAADLGVDGASQIDHAPMAALAQFRCNERPEMIHPARIVSYEIAIPRSANKSSTSRKLSVNRR